MKPTQVMLRHVRAYGLTIAPVAARALRLPTGEAHAVLEGLVRTGALFAHRASGALYFTHARQPLDDDELRESFAVLWFCCMSHPEHPLVHPNTLRERLDHVLREDGRPLPGRTRCYLTPEGELSLIRAAHSGPPDVAIDLQRVVGGLQRFVTSRQFRLWRAYARREPFSITCLLEDDANVQELAAWLTRHPLVAVEAIKADRRVGEQLEAGPENEHHEGVLIPVLAARLERLRRR